MHGPVDTSQSRSSLATWSYTGDKSEPQVAPIQEGAFCV